MFQTADEPVEALTGDIQFERVDFRYGSKEQVLSDFNLHIEPGESIALVGHTGAGKSSIAKLVGPGSTSFRAAPCGSTAATSAPFHLHSYRRRLGQRQPAAVPVCGQRRR